MNWLFIGFLFLNFVLSTAGDTAAKLWAIHPGPKWLVVTTALAAITSVSFMLVIRQSGLAVGGTVMLLLTMLASCLIGLLFFKEQINTSQLVGIVLGFIAVLFLTGIIKFPQ